MLERAASEAYRVLVVDDNESIHSDIRKILDRPDQDELAPLENVLLGLKPKEVPDSPTLEIDSAFQGQEGLSMLESAIEQRANYAVAFVDMRMPPGWNGLETAKRLWAVDPSLQIILCTAYSDFSWQQIVEELGHSDGFLILKKPFDAAEVQQLVTAQCAKWKQTQANLAMIEELKKQTSLLQERASRDDLTGLFTRGEMDRVLVEEISRHERYGTPFSFLLVDIDRFKRINDQYGHQVGDGALRWIANRIHSLVRPTDHVSRYGGEELAIVAPQLNEGDVLIFAERMRNSIGAHPFKIDGSDDPSKQIVITVSIGAAVFPNHATTLTGLIAAADRALYRAKNDGRNRTILAHSDESRPKEIATVPEPPDGYLL